MEYYKYIFVILVYRNTNDLEDCLASITEKVSSCKSVIVNAYYDDDSLHEVERIANLYHCDFISIENKGYRYGNNRGMEFALKHYLFDYVIISNPDIVIENFDDTFIGPDFEYDIIAPQIIAASGKAQNPAMFKRLPLSEYLIYCGYKLNSRLLLMCGLTISKIIREFISHVKKIRKQRVYDIYCAHGSFLLLSKRIVEKLKPVYDDRVFLFGEEGILAYKAKKTHFKTCYSDFISIKHKEDGSMKLSDLSINGEMRKSNIFYYENYIKPQ
jgi:GT2 family glycosyltransferase